MSALDELKHKQYAKMTALEFCIIRYVEANRTHEAAEQAAEELADLRAKLDEAIKWHEGDDSEHARMEQDLAALNAVVEAINEAIEQIKDWRDKAYPLDIFPEPDLKKARQLLEAGEMTLDSVSASNMRHVTTRVCEMLSAALEKVKGRKG